MFIIKYIQAVRTIFVLYVLKKLFALERMCSEKKTE